MPRPSGTWAMPLRAISSVLRPSMRLASKLISPSVRTMPQTARKVVVLPAPLAPRIVVMPPSFEREIDAVQDLVPARRTPADCGPAAASPSVRGPEIGANDVGMLLDLRRRAVGDLAAEIERDDVSDTVITRFM